MIPDIDRRDLELTSEESELLDKLGTDEDVLVEDCNPLALDHLIELGFAETYEMPFNLNRRVHLTDEGFSYRRGE
jgi:hypothetical protein